MQTMRALPRLLRSISGQALFAVSLAAVLTAPVDGIAATQETAPPLGILIVPEGEVPPEPTVVPAPAQNETRPLGMLLGPNAAAPAVAPALPAAPFQPRPQALPVIEPVVHVPAPGNSNQRPLGVLLEEPLPYQPQPQSAAPRPTAQPAYKPTPGIPRVALPAAPGASADRPLGTLISPAPEGITGAKTSVPAAVTPSPIAPPNAPPAATAVTVPQTPAAPATEARDGPPVRLVADEMSFDRDKEIVTASGNVQITYADRTLVADQVTYNQKDDVATAIGHVALRDATGERMFGDRMDISGDLKDAVVYNIGLILQDRSRIAGTGARHSAGRMTELSKGVYSPCEPCAKNPNSPPLWQIKAVKVIHDKEEKIVQYRDAWIELFGYPVAYTPYFRHPDPTVKRKSGFLFPRFGSSSDFGAFLETPYFWAISDNEDATIRPIVMTDAAPVLAVQYRKRLLKGEIDMDGSVTNNDHDYATEKGEFGMRGHLKAKGRFDINRTWRWGFDVERATDDTYMRRYGFDSPPSLDSQAFVEGFRRNNYISVRTLVFQGLQETDTVGASPIVLPLVDYNFEGDRDRLGGRSKFDFNFMALTRADGTDTRRITMRPFWERGFRDSFGSIYTFQTGVNADFYHVNSLARSGGKADYDGVSYRMFPFAGLEWRLPLIKEQGTVRQVLEPIVSAAIAPNGGNPDKIPNEDSTDFEFDETNVFSLNRFSGIDRVEGGPRINYGLKWGLYGEGGGSTTAFLGQTYRPREDSTFASGSGLEDKFSDLVAAVSVSPGSYLSALYRTRLATDNISPNRNELSLTVGVPALRVSGNYVFLAKQAGSEFSGREELNMTASSVINRFWRASLSGVRDMESDEMRTANLSATYEDECTIFTTRISRTFYEDRDLKPTDAITFQLTLKTLGEVKTGANITSN
jgi:LPS-assembly protein